MSTCLYITAFRTVLIMCAAGQSDGWEHTVCDARGRRGSLLLDVRGDAAPASRREYVRAAHWPLVLTALDNREESGAGHCERVLLPLHQSALERTLDQLWGHRRRGNWSTGSSGSCVQVSDQSAQKSRYTGRVAGATASHVHPQRGRGAASAAFSANRLALTLYNNSD